MRQQSFVGRVWLDITEREKSHPIIYMTKIGKVSDVNAMRLTRPCASAGLIFICVATLAEYLFHCFSTGNSAHQADWGGNFVMELSRDPQNNEGTCQGTWMPVLQQGTSLQENSPSWQSGEEQAQQMRAAEQGGSSEPKCRRDLNRGGSTDRLQKKEYGHVGWACKDGGRKTFCFKPVSSVTQKVKGKSLVSTLTLEERVCYPKLNSHPTACAALPLQCLSCCCLK